MVMVEHGDDDVRDHLLRILRGFGRRQLGRRERQVSRLGATLAWMTPATNETDGLTAHPVYSRATAISCHRDTCEHGDDVMRANTAQMSLRTPGDRKGSHHVLHTTDRARRHR